MAKTLYIPLSFLLFFLLLQGAFSSLKAQEPAYWRLTDEDGLPSRTIYRLLQDSKDFIWMATANGLCRYDGKSFKYYSSPLMNGNEILNIKDIGGRIHFINGEGQLFYIEQDQIQTYASDRLLADYVIFDFDVNKQDYFTVRAVRKGTLQLLIYKRLANDSLVFQHSVVQCLDFYQDNQSLISLERMGYDQNAILQITEYPFGDWENPIIWSKDSKPAWANGRTKLFRLPNRDLILLVDNGLLAVDREKGIKRLFTAKEDQSLSVPHRYGDEVWVTTKKGLLQIDYEEEVKIARHLLPAYNINTVLKDREGNYWLGTLGEGLLIIPSLDILSYSTERGTLPDNNVFDLAKGKSGELLVSQDKGYLSFIDQSKNVRSLKVFEDARILKTRTQGDWLFCAGDQGFKLIKHNQHLLSHPYLERFRTPSIKTFTQDDNQQHWLGSSISTTNIKINVADLPASTLLSRDLKYRSQLIIREKTFALYNDRFSDLMWLGTIKGLFYYQDSTQQVIKMEGPAGRDMSIVDIQQSDDSIIWVSTQQDGVFGLLNNRLVEHYTLEKGLVSNNCKSLAVEGNDYLWVGTDKGLNRIDRRGGQIDLINRYDGLISEEVFAILLDEEQLWAGTSRGLFQIPYSSIKSNDQAPSVYIKNVKIWEKEEPLATSYDLAYDQNNLYIQFVGPAFRSRGRHRYAYRMLGVDTTWVDTEVDFARYPTLAPGRYEFQVLALNEDGVRSEQAAVLSLKIAPPWWQRWWFRIASLLALLALTGGSVYWRFQRIRQRDLEKQAIRDRFNELEMKALQVQMNPHFVFNALNAIQKYLTTNEQESAMGYLSKFARLIRLIFEYSKRKVISLEDELDFLRLYLQLEQLRFKNKIDIQLEVAPTIQEQKEEIYLPPLLIQPIVENAFKHGLLHKKDNGKLLIRFEEKANMLRCIIEDDGVGREQAAQFSNWRPANYQSSGLSTTKQRLALFNQANPQDTTLSMLELIDLYDEEANSAGTRVILTICKISG
ncbi:MAG: histidine kinase [Bacteroidota bacterium]